MLDYLKISAEEAEKGINNGHGGPFGAVIVKDGKIISRAHNEVLKRNDPTAHAEILAIRKAAEVLKTPHLKGTVLYSTCEPCPMCLAAILWARIDKVVFACDRKDAADIGFDDNLFYEFFNNPQNVPVILDKMESEDCRKLFKKYKSLPSKRLY